MLKFLIDAVVQMRFQTFPADLPDPRPGADGRGPVLLVLPNGTIEEAAGGETALQPRRGSRSRG